MAEARLKEQKEKESAPILAANIWSAQNLTWASNSSTAPQWSNNGKRTLLCRFMLVKSSFRNKENNFYVHCLFVLKHIFIFYLVASLRNRNLL